MTDNEQRYDFAPGEREAIERQMAEREARDKSAEMLAWARAQAAERSAPKSRQPVPVAVAPASLTAGWQTYIKYADRRVLRLCMETVGEVLVEERNKMRAELRAELEREVSALRADFLRSTAQSHKRL